MQESDLSSQRALDVYASRSLQHTITRESMLATARLRAVAPPSSFIRGFLANNVRTPNAFPKYSRLKAQNIRHSSTFPRTPSFVPYFTKAKAPYRSLGRHILWTLPIAGGAVLYFSQSKPVHLPSVFSSPHLIPVPPHQPEDDTTENQSEAQLVINSPDEEDRSILARIRRLLNDWLWEPLFTARRFAFLLIIFVPVILTSPAVCFGTVEGRAGERTGALWWYNLLVRALQRAGPTFIKARKSYYSRRISASSQLYSLPNGPLHEKTYSLQNFVEGWGNYTQTENLIQSDIPGE